MITIIDSIMGSGKTTFMIDYMSRRYSEATLNPTGQPPCFLYVAPSLTEVERIKQACPLLEFRDPQNVRGRKLNHLLDLINQDQNIATTHALFKLMDKDVYEALRNRHYVLIIDEELECVRLSSDISKHDLAIIRNQGLVSTELGRDHLIWNGVEDDVYDGQFNKVRSLMQIGNLILHQNTLMWVFPIEFFACFKEAYLLTYMFEGSPMSSYLKANGVAYRIKTLNRQAELVPYTTAGVEAETKATVRSLITVYKGQANECGNSGAQSNPFSSSWCKRMGGKEDGRQALARIKASLSNWFKKTCRTPSSVNAWTSFKAIQKHLAGVPYSKGFIPCNAKGTNDYRHKQSLAYLCNIYLNPQIASYLRSKGIEPNDDAFALSEMVQWVWRSRIREKQPINLFIPSDRMRGLFLRWLDASTSANANASYVDGEAA